TNEHAFNRSLIWNQAQSRPGDHLPDVLTAAADIAANVIRVVTLHFHRRHGVSADDAVPEARSEPLNLRFDTVCHIHGRTVRYVAVSPCGVFVAGSPRSIKQALLGE